MVGMISRLAVLRYGSELTQDPWFKMNGKSVAHARLDCVVNRERIEDQSIG